MALVLALVLLSFQEHVASLPVTSTASQELFSPLEELTLLDGPAAIDLDAELGRDRDGREVLPVEEPIALLIGKDVKRVLGKKGLSNSRSGYQEDSKSSEVRILGSHELISSNVGLMKILDNVFLEDPEDAELRKAVAQLLREVQDIGAKKHKKKMEYSNETNNKSSAEAEIKEENEESSNIKAGHAENNSHKHKSEKDGSKNDSKRNHLNDNESHEVLKPNSEVSDDMIDHNHDKNEVGKTRKDEVNSAHAKKNHETNHDGNDENYQKNHNAREKKHRDVNRNQERKKIHVLRKTRTRHHNQRPNVNHNRPESKKIKDEKQHSDSRKGISDDVQFRISHDDTQYHHAAEEVGKHGNSSKLSDEHHDNNQEKYHGDIQQTLKNLGDHDEKIDFNNKNHLLMDKNNHDNIISEKPRESNEYSNIDIKEHYDNHVQDLRKHDVDGNLSDSASEESNQRSEDDSADKSIDSTSRDLKDSKENNSQFNEKPGNGEDFDPSKIPYLDHYDKDSTSELEEPKHENSLHHDDHHATQSQNHDNHNDDHHYDYHNEELADHDNHRNTAVIKENSNDEDLIPEEEEYDDQDGTKLQNHDNHDDYHHGDNQDISHQSDHSNTEPKNHDDDDIPVNTAVVKENHKEEGLISEEEHLNDDDNGNTKAEIIGNSAHGQTENVSAVHNDVGDNHLHSDKLSYEPVSEVNYDRKSDEDDDHSKKGLNSPTTHDKNNDSISSSSENNHDSSEIHKNEGHNRRSFALEHKSDEKDDVSNESNAQKCRHSNNISRPLRTYSLSFYFRK